MCFHTAKSKVLSILMAYVHIWELTKLYIVFFQIFHTVLGNYRYSSYNSHCNYSDKNIKPVSDTDRFFWAKHRNVINFKVRLLIQFFFFSFYV